MPFDIQGALSLSPRAARAHAMKNCVGVIVAISHLLQKELSGASQERTARLRATASRLRELLADDLRDEGLAVHAPPEPTTCCVASLVETVTEQLADRAETAGVELFVQCGGGTLLGEERALREALFNLVANAIEATGQAGGVFLATYVTNRGDQHWVVQDTGCGMPADQLRELGKPFRSRREGGSGLGLAIARETVEAHGGSMCVESTVGAGTTITVSLPRKSAREDARGS